MSQILKRALVFALSGFLLTAPVMAQETESETTNADTATTETDAPAAEEGSAFPTAAEQTPPQAQQRQEVVDNTFEDWQVRCADEKKSECFMYQLVTAEDGNALMELTIVELPNGGDAVYGVTLVTPLNMLLKRGIYMQIDGNDPNQYFYDFCNQVGCFARFGLTTADTNQWKNGDKSVAVLFAVRNPREGMEIPFSLKGFTAAGNRLSELRQASAE